MLILLDLVISESQESVDEVKNIGQFVDSDHSMLHWNICYENETRDEKSSSENFDYAKGNYGAVAVWVASRPEACRLSQLQGCGFESAPLTSIA